MDEWLIDSLTLCIPSGHFCFAPEKKQSVSTCVALCDKTCIYIAQQRVMYGGVSGARQAMAGAAPAANCRAHRTDTS